ncbi:ankyrin repeat protein [Stachybotrys elegans]|uniref:Ankyrin repeat protein n=1 Tax=Stachybotrys elegans TaxID=80388 RepID=A0A8K0SMD0_9HYPO|nr:ankyrin repeat protein [Stachybotrys elegans]
MPSNDSYTVGWICAIQPEFVAALAFLDKDHGIPDFIAQRDNNSYALGSIGKHNVVIATLPDGQCGKVSAAAVARDMLSSFPNIRIGLMVGIGGGAPSAKNDIRLGDVVVSAPRSDQGGVFQYDYGKTIQNQAFQVTGVQDQPPMLLRTAVANLRARYVKNGHTLAESIEAALKTIKMRKQFVRPVVDRLFSPDTLHSVNATDCDACDASQIILRTPRDEEDDNPAIHYGNIASADTLMKDAKKRDKLAAEKDVLCFEMEAAGLMSHFPCLVIRGIYNYSDSHKNNEWQGYAAMAAAAYAKDLLRLMPLSNVEVERRIIDACEETNEKMDSVVLATMETTSGVKQAWADRHTAAIKTWLHPPGPTENANQARKLHHQGTGAWLLRHPSYQEWLAGQRRALWMSGLAGCGKTALSSTVVDNLTENRNNVTLSFFFDLSDVRKQTREGMLRSLAWQLYRTASENTAEVDEAFKTHNNGDNQLSENHLSQLFWKLLANHPSPFIILDALDESTTRTELVSWIKETMARPELGHVRLLFTSRPEDEFLRKIPLLIGQGSCLALDKKAVNVDIRSFVSARLSELPDFVDECLPQDLQELILNKVGDGADGMFRWASCQLRTLADCKSISAIKKH